MKKSATALVVLSCLAACRGADETPHREPPPPAAAATPHACANGGGELKDADAAKAFPRTIGSLCIDPNGSEKAYGEGSKDPIERICDVFDGECEIYLGFGVRRVVELRYVDGSGAAATIDVHFSRFGTREGAYAMFTKRVVGDGDPAHPDTPSPVALDGQGALGKGTAYVWRGNYLAELTYSDEAAAEAAIDAAGKQLLPPLMKDVASKITGDASLPPAAAALPRAGLLPLGVRYVTKDLLGVEGLGGGAFGYYKDGDKRFRFASVTRADVDQAKDAVASFAKLPGASREKNVEEGAVRFMRKDPAVGDPREAEWIVARLGKTVLAIGDEPRATSASASAEDHAKVTLTREEKIERLKKALEAK